MTSVARVLKIAVVLGAAAGMSLISGCASIGAVAGAAAGVATGVVTTNPAIGIGVGIAVQAGTDEVVAHVMKNLHADQQNAIVLVASTEPVGDVQPWNVKHTLPVENGHGEVRTLREFDSALATCREFAFSVIDGDKADAKEAWFIASACKQQDGWKWASAEPAVPRWGNLQ